MHQILRRCRIVSALKLDDLRLFIDGLDLLAARLGKLKPTDTKRVVAVLAAIFVQGFVDADLRMRQELFLGEVRRGAGDGEIIAHRLGDVTVGAKKLNRDLVGQRRHGAVCANALEIEGDGVVDILLDLELPVVAIGGVDGALDLGRQLFGVIQAGVDVDADRLVRVVDIHKKEVLAPIDVAAAIAAFAGGFEHQRVSDDLDELVTFLAKVEACLFTADLCRLRWNQGLQVIKLVERRSLSFDEVVVIRNGGCLLTEPVNEDLLAGVVDRADEIRIDDRVVDHQAGVVFVGRIVRRSGLGLDEVDRGNCGVTEIVKDRDRG